MIMDRPQDGIQATDVDLLVDRVFLILKKCLSEPVISVYQTKLNASLDIHAVRAILHQTQPGLDTSHFDQKTMVEHLDLHAWISLILQRWDLFEPILKNAGRDAIERLQAIYLERLADKAVSAQDALYAAVSAHEMLAELYCKSQAAEVALIRDQLLLTNQKGAKVPGAQKDTTAKEHGSDTLETPIAKHSPGAVNGHAPSTNGHGVHPLPELLAAKAETGEKPQPVVRLDKSRTRRIAPPTPNTALQVEIVKRHGDASSQKIDLSKPSVLVGRSLMADIEVSDPRVSRVHLLIAGSLESGIKVTDLHSANGTYLDGMPLPPNCATVWEVGQSITIGETLLILRQTI